jgi:hypothetical protein
MRSYGGRIKLNRDGDFWLTCKYAEARLLDAVTKLGNLINWFYNLP